MFTKIQNLKLENRFVWMAGPESHGRAPERVDAPKEKQKESDPRKVASAETAADQAGKELENKQYEMAARTLAFNMGRIQRILQDPRLTTSFEKQEQAKPFIEELEKAGFKVSIRGERGDILVVTPPDSEKVCPSDFGKNPNSPASKDYLASLVRERGIKGQLPNPAPQTAVANSGF